MPFKIAGAALLCERQFSRQNYKCVHRELASEEAGRATDIMDEDDGRVNQLIFVLFVLVSLLFE